MAQGDFYCAAASSAAEPLVPSSGLSASRPSLRNVGNPPIHGCGLSSAQHGLRHGCVAYCSHNSAEVLGLLHFSFRRRRRGHPIPGSHYCGRSKQIVASLLDLPPWWRPCTPSPRRDAYITRRRRSRFRCVLYLHKCSVSVSIPSATL